MRLERAAVLSVQICPPGAGRVTEKMRPEKEREKTIRNASHLPARTEQLRRSWELKSGRASLNRADEMQALSGHSDRARAQAQANPRINSKLFDNCIFWTFSLECGAFWAAPVRVGAMTSMAGHAFCRRRQRHLSRPWTLLLTP